MPRPKAHQHRVTFVLGQPHKFRLTGDNLTAATTVSVTETNPGVAWSKVGPGDIHVMADGFYFTSTPNAVVPLDAGAPGDGSTTIVVTNPPDTPGGPPLDDQSPPMIPAYYSSSTLIS